MDRAATRDVASVDRVVIYLCATKWAVDLIVALTKRQLRQRDAGQPDSFATRYVTGREAAAPANFEVPVPAHDDTAKSREGILADSPRHWGSWGHVEDAQGFGRSTGSGIGEVTPCNHRAGLGSEAAPASQQKKDFKARSASYAFGSQPGIPARDGQQ